MGDLGGERRVLLRRDDEANTAGIHTWSKWTGVERLRRNSSPQHRVQSEDFREIRTREIRSEGREVPTGGLRILGEGFDSALERWLGRGTPERWARQ